MAHSIEVLSGRVLAHGWRGSELSSTGTGVHPGAKAAQVSPSTVERSFVLRQRLSALTDDLYELWHDALASRDFELVTNTAEASRCPPRHRRARRRPNRRYRPPIERNRVVIAHHAVPSLSICESETRRGLLLAELAVKAGQLEQRRAALVHETPVDPSGLERAMSVLHLFAALDEVDQIRAALTRMDAGPARTPA